MSTPPPPSPDLEPSAAAIHQAEAPGADEAPLSAIPVQVVGPVRTQDPPARMGSSSRRRVSSTTPVRLAGADPKRSRLVLRATQPVYLAESKEALQLGLTVTGAALPVYEHTTSTDGALVIEDGSEVWCLAVSTSADVSLRYVRWAL